MTGSSIAPLKAPYKTYAIVAALVVLSLNQVMDLSSYVIQPGGSNDNQQTAIRRAPQGGPYEPAKVEAYVLEHTRDLGYSVEDPNPTGCNIWKQKEFPFYQDLQTFFQELEIYSEKIKSFTSLETDLRVLLKENPDAQDEICHRLELHPDGIPGLFAKSQQYSLTPRTGYVEPLLPPMRHPAICLKGNRGHLMRMDYMIHDFAHMCRSLRPGIRTVFIDMGASLDFHAGAQSPAMYITELYSKFGFQFDHIYAFEVSEKKPKDVYNKVPKELMASYHWINIGVDADPESKYNPLVSILQSFNRDDFVVVKLDIDTPHIEIPLAYQVMNDPRLYNLIDQFYFEHHVHLAELAANWKTQMNNTIEASLELFNGIRKKGVAAHFWPWDVLGWLMLCEIFEKKIVIINSIGF